MVDDRGIGPLTSSVSRKRSTSELIVRDLTGKNSTVESLFCQLPSQNSFSHYFIVISPRYTYGAIMNLSFGFRLTSIAMPAFTAFASRPASRAGEKRKRRRTGRGFTQNDLFGAEASKSSLSDPEEAGDMGGEGYRPGDGI